jgi:hypothetical protein
VTLCSLVGVYQILEENTASNLEDRSDTLLSVSTYKTWLGGCGLDSTGSGQAPVAGCCECGDEPSGSCAMELVS